MEKEDRKRFWELWWNKFNPILFYTLLFWVMTFAIILFFNEIGLIPSFKNWLAATIFAGAVALVILIVFGWLIFRAIKRK